jgi:hypothetical protein
MTILNGHDEGPLAGWVIAQSNGLTLVGLPTYGGEGKIHSLSPVLHMQQNLAQGPNGGATPIHPCFPLFLFAINEVQLPGGAIVIPVALLSKVERDHLAKFVEQGMEIMGQMKAAAMGIQLAKSVPPARGMPRRPG